MQPSVFYLIGHAGVGKYTIGQALVRATGARLIDNHLINNPIFTLLRLDGKTPIPAAAWDQVEVIRQTVIDSAATLSPPDFSFVFTNELLADEPDAPRWYNAIADLAQRRKAQFRPVLLTAAPDVHRKRIIAPGRAERYKTIDPARIDAIQSRPLYGHGLPGIQHLDVTDLSPDQAAQAILAFSA